MNDNEKDKIEYNWPSRDNFKKSIKLEFSIYISGMIGLLMLIAGVIITTQYVDTVTRNIADKLLVQARSYSGPAGKLIISTAGPDALLLNNICRKLSEDNSEVFWVAIADQNDKLLAHTNIKKVMAGESQSAFIGDEYEDLVRPQEGFEFLDDTLFITVPIKEGKILVGRLSIASSSLPIATAKNKSMMVVGSITIFVLLLGLPLTMIGLRRKLLPITTIAEHLQNIKFDDIKLEIPVNSRNELGYLSETLRVMGSKLNSAQKQIVEKERFERELEIAREIQSNILPSDYPQNKSFEFAAYYHSAREVGGDYYDFIKIDEHKIGFIVADVSGKSLPGMLVMLLTRDIVLKLSHSIVEPDQLLSQVNAELASSIKRGMFVTMFYGVIDTTTGKFSFASAGHNPLVILRKSGEPELIKTKGFPLGIANSEKFRDRIELGQAYLKPGDYLVQFTDGINEAQNEQGEEYGMEKFVNSLISAQNLSVDQLISKAVSDNDSFIGNAEQFDDITLLAMKWNGTSVDNSNKKDKVEAYVE